MPAETEAPAPHRRSVLVLAVAQALFMSTQAMGISATPLAAFAMLGMDKSFATVPVFLTQVGIMTVTIPASLLMARIGRRAGFSIGAAFTILFGVVAAVAVWRQSFPMLCVSAVLQGAAAAFAWYYRFAAADASPMDFKAKAISYVLAGGIVAGLVGPQLAKFTVEWFAPVAFLGVYVAIGMLGVASLLLVQLVRVPPLTAAERGAGGRSLLAIARQPTFVTAVLSSMLGYGVMTLVMSVTPLAMRGCGFAFADSATVIQVHIVAMFLPSFWTGGLIQRFGVLAIIATGAVLEAGCALVNLAGIDFANFLLGNALVGLGWNFTYVGGSTLLTRTYRPAERAKAQAAHDFSVYAATAAAAALAGYMQQNAGWAMINAVALPLMAVVAAATLWLARHQRCGTALAPAE
jgi:predicted MFS family arabinose efflux permease